MDSGTLGRDYADREAICRQGEPADVMYVIQAGRVAVVREQDGADVVLTELASGDTFGELALVDRELRSATVRAVGRARVLTLDRRTSCGRCMKILRWPFAFFRAWPGGSGP